jgi:MFS family permease
VRQSISRIAFAFCLTFASSAGQTFFLSLFIPNLSQASGASAGELAVAYGLATLAAAAAMPWLGRANDRMDGVRCAILIGAATLCGALLFASTASLPQAFIAMLLLRLFGQGLLPHVGLAALARRAGRSRGRDLSIATLGYPVSEGLLPLAATLVTPLLGWRLTYSLAGLALGLLLVPLASALILSDRRFRRPPAPATGEASPDAAGPKFRFGRLWPYLPLLALPSFAITALLFLQTEIARDEHLAAAIFASAFAGFALVQIPASLFFGWVADRLGSRTGLVLHALPMALGAAIFALLPSGWAVWAYMALVGVSAGGSLVLRTSIVAEVAPAHMLGAARAKVAALLVIAAACGPAAYGALLFLGIGTIALLWSTAALCIAATMWPLLGRASAAAMRPGSLGSKEI